MDANLNSDRDSKSGIFFGRSCCLLTRRLEIAPLTRSEFESYLTAPKKLAKRLALSNVPEELEPEAFDAFHWLLDVGLRLDKFWIVYGSIWAIVERATRRFIGVLGFKGEPIDGSAELFYRVDRRFRRRGYMTEAVCAVVEWGIKREELREIVAETLSSNLASQRVLIKAGFRASQSSFNDESATFWRINVSNPHIE